MEPIQPKNAQEPSVEDVLDDMFSKPSTTTSNPIVPSVDPVDDQPIPADFFKGVQAVLSPEDRVLANTLDTSQAVWGILRTLNPPLADALIRGVGGCTVKELRAFAAFIATTVSVLDGGSIFPAFVMRSGLADVPRRVLQAALIARTAVAETFLLPSTVGRQALPVLAQFCLEMPNIAKTGLVFNVGGQGETVVPFRAFATDASNAGVLALLGKLTRRDFVTVPLMVERFLRTLFAIAPVAFIAVEHGKGHIFGEIKHSELPSYRKSYVLPCFHANGELIKPIAECVHTVLTRLNASPIPQGISLREPLKTACWQIRRLGTSTTAYFERMGEVFFKTFQSEFAQVSRTLSVMYADYLSLPYGDMASRDTIEKKVKLDLPVTCLVNLWTCRNYREIAKLDKPCEHLTQNNYYADSGLSVTTKIMACLVTHPLPPVIKKGAVLGADCVYDMNLWPPSTTFYDLKGGQVGAVTIHTLDVNNRSRLDAALSGLQFLFSDVCPPIPATISLSKLAENCSYAKNLTLISNICKAACGVPEMEWFCIKMFLAPLPIQMIPEFLLGPMRVWGGYYIVNSGKLHSDEFYVIFSRSAPRRTLGYWKYSMWRIATGVMVGNEIAMRGVSAGMESIFPSLEAKAGWLALKPNHLPYTLGKGTGYKGFSDDDLEDVLDSMYADDEFPVENPSAGTSDDPATMLKPPSSSVAQDELVDRKSASPVAAATAASHLAVASRRDGVEPGWDPTATSAAAGGSNFNLSPPAGPPSKQ